jgi:hypothetical protein
MKRVKRQEGNWKINNVPVCADLKMCVEIRQNDGEIGKRASVLKEKVRKHPLSQKKAS